VQVYHHFKYKLYEKGLSSSGVKIMPFQLPKYNPPDFTRTPLCNAPTITVEPVKKTGVAPENFHATSIYPEYFHIQKGKWVLLKDSRMDCVVVLEKDGTLIVKEFRHLAPGERVVCGRSENGKDGIYVHTKGFQFPAHVWDKFSFRMFLTRETSFSFDYDELYDLLFYERDNGFILWVSGPAVVFDRDAREAFVHLIERGYVHGLLAGNALAVHDVEGAFFNTALGQDIYTKRYTKLGHYKHLDAINRIRESGSIKQGIEKGIIENGVVHALIKNNIPFVLAGSIRDDGPLPEVIADVYKAQGRMRALTSQATTIITLATQLHAIATGNMSPSYRVMEDGNIRPVYFYSVDMSEFAVTKLANRGSLTARSILTNVQDFMVNVRRGLEKREKIMG